MRQGHHDAGGGSFKVRAKDLIFIEGHAPFLLRISNGYQDDPNIQSHPVND
jgi:hypothetical protein